MTQPMGRFDALAEEARAAAGQRDPKAALAAWLAIEQDREVQLGIATALREAFRWDEADARFKRLHDLYPEDEAIVVGHAWVAHGRGAYREAAQRWTEVREKWPEQMAAYHGGGAALRAIGAYDESNAVYEQAFERGLKYPALMHDYALLASTRGDHGEAALRWAAYREKAPNAVEGYTSPAAALAAAGDFDGARDLYQTAIARFPDNKDLTLQYARTVRRHGTLEAALKVWEAVIAGDHGQVEAYLGAAEALAGLGRIEDAQTVLQPAVRLFGDNRAVLDQQTRLAQQLRDWDTALAGWAAIRTRFPDDPSGWSNTVSTLRAANRYADAEAMAKEGVERFPDNFQLHFEWAQLPQMVQDYRENVRRFRELIAKFPEQRLPRVFLADSLGRENDWEGAEATLAQAIDELGPCEDFAFASARNADLVRRFDIGLVRWTALRDDYPESVTAHLGVARCLREQGRFDECRDLLDAAAVRFPTSVEVRVQQALLANRLRDWAVALPIWAELKQRHPQRGDIAAGVTDALWQARQDQAIAEDGKPAFEIPEILLQASPNADEEAKRLRQIFMRFESIGDSCEFGMAQRRFHAEPIGLLRWAGIPPDRVILGVKGGFASMTDPEKTAISVVRGEYVVRNSDYGLFSHTFTAANSEPIERFSRSQRARLKFLTQKLQDDFGFAEKIFVYSHSEVTLEQCHELHQAIRAYGGRSCLLCMRLADDDHELGRIDTPEDGLYIAYTDRYSNVDINFDNWREVCTRVSAMWDETLPEGAPDA